MRDRAWRRHTNDKILVRKIKSFSRDMNFYKYKDCAGYVVENPNWMDYLNTHQHFNLKSIGSPWRYTGEGLKYSPNKSIRGRNHRWGRPGNTPDTREFNNRLLIRIKREYGLK